MDAGIAILIILVGVAVSVSALIRRLFSRVKLPAMIGYIGLGLAVVTADSRWRFLPKQTHHVGRFLAEVGIIILLFRVGLESKLKQLLSQLGKASVIGFMGIVVAGALAFVVSLWVLHLTVSLSLIIAAAMVATSVGVPATLWDEAGAIETGSGQLLLDVAEFDDIAGVILMAMLFAVIPAVAQPQTSSPTAVLLSTGVRFAITLFLYGGACTLFAHYAEQRITRFLANCEEPAEETLSVIAIGMIIAAIAGLLGFSVAIGAFFAGLVFSRDPESIKSRATFRALYDLFTPFFFIGIGLQMQPNTFGPALVPAAILIGVAFAGKFIGTAAVARLWCRRETALLLGLSMVPRAEIAMIISQRAVSLEARALPDYLFSAMVFTCLATCIVPPLILGRLLPGWRNHSSD